VALLRKITCNFRHPIGLCHQVISIACCITITCIHQSTYVYVKHVRIILYQFLLSQGVGREYLKEIYKLYNITRPSDVPTKRVKCILCISRRYVSLYIHKLYNIRRIRDVPVLTKKKKMTSAATEDQ